MDSAKIDYRAIPDYAARKKFFFDLGQTGFVHRRRGESQAQGWEFSQTYRLIRFVSRHRLS